MAAWRRAGEPYSAEYRLGDAAAARWVRRRGTAWQVEDKVGGRVGVVEDVTAQREAEEARAEAEQRYRTLLDLAPEAIGQPLATLLPIASRDSHTSYVSSFGRGQSAATRPMGTRADVRGRRKDEEEFPCEASIIRQTLRGKTLYTAIVHKVSRTPRA